MIKNMNTNTTRMDKIGKRAPIPNITSYGCAIIKPLKESVQLQPGKGKGYVGTSFLPILTSSDENSYQTTTEEDPDSLILTFR